MTETLTYDMDLELVTPFGDVSVPVKEKVSAGYTIEELIREHSPRLNLPARDADGRDHVYQALRERDQMRLFDSQRVVEVIEPGDEVVLQPYVAAGGTECRISGCGPVDNAPARDRGSRG